MLNIIFLILVAVIQATLLGNFRLFYAMPDLLLIMVVFYSLLKDKKAGVFFGMWSGFIKDILSGSIFGINLFSFTLCSYFLGNQNKRLYIENKITHIAVTFLCALIISLLNFIFLRLNMNNIPFFYYLLVFTLPYCIYNSIFAALLANIFIKVFSGAKNVTQVRYL